MRQVPNKKTSYLIIGGGRLATHLGCYFNYCLIPFTQWKRSDGTDLLHLVAEHQKILCAISDDSLIEFIKPLKKQFPNKKYIHFSGFVYSAMADGAHPLMSFGTKMLTLYEYEVIPFITENGKTSFNELFPELINPSFSIPGKEKPLYHAWCSMAGNFTSMIWITLRKQFEIWNLPASVVQPYLQQIVHNALSIAPQVTGPIVRGDRETIEGHKKALENSIYLELYQAFEKVIQREHMV